MHRQLKARTADAEQTLSDGLMAPLERVGARPTRDEILSRIDRRRRVAPKSPTATVIREERESAQPRNPSSITVA